VGLVVLSVAASTLARSISSHHFDGFVKQYNKKYAPDEYNYRLKIFLDNLQTIEKHNKNSDASFQLGVNQFADLTNEEYTKMLTLQPTQGIVSVDERFVGAAPASLDWRTSKTPVVVGPVENNGQCGGAGTVRHVFDSISGAYSVSNKEDFYRFNTTYYTDCVKTGCSGTVDAVWQYVQKYGLWWYYEGDCPANPSVGMCISGVTYIKSGSESALQDAVANKGPIVVSVDASLTSFQLYASGVYADAKCNSTALDLALLVVGYGTLNGQDYWIAKNNWGSTWGQAGYINIARNKNNMCGIASYASYATKVGNCVCSIEV